MKIIIDDKESNWYLQDLNNYNNSYLIAIIMDLYVKVFRKKS